MVEEEPNSPPQSPPPLAYERSTGVTRGAFRLLLLLTFINTILLAMSLMGPQNWQAVRSAYTGFKDRRAAAAAAAQREAAQRAALQAAVGLRFPEGYVGYTEVPDEAMRLMSQGAAYQPIQTAGGRSQTPPPGWQAPVVAHPQPALVKHGSLGAEGSLFVHERTSPNGTKMLVLVLIRATYEFDNETRLLNGHKTEETTYRLSRQRRLQAAAFTTAPNGKITLARRYELELILPDARPTEVAVGRRPRDGSTPATMPSIATTHQLRFFGGSPDPADGSHFTLPYELDGQPGVIDGWLRDDGLVLTPRQGHAIPTAKHPHWDLLPATQPATQAAGSL